jgi:hypothetical protein
MNSILQRAIFLPRTRQIVWNKFQCRQTASSAPQIPFIDSFEFKISLLGASFFLQLARFVNSKFETEELKHEKYLFEKSLENQVKSLQQQIDEKLRVSRQNTTPINKTDDKTSEKQAEKLDLLKIIFSKGQNNTEGPKENSVNQEVTKNDDKEKQNAK